MTCPRCGIFPWREVCKRCGFERNYDNSNYNEDLFRHIRREDHATKASHPITIFSFNLCVISH